MFTWKISFFVVLIKLSSSDDPLLVTTSLGKIKGHYRMTPDAKIKYKAYEGIPFAQSPVGEKRFLPPIPATPWRETLRAEKLKESCFGRVATRQYGVLYFGSEDCLYLNVYVPDKINDNQPIPVIVHIYAGAFQFSGLLGTEQDQFMDKNVIFVTFNHRHGVLGFLSTEDDVVPGNMGLKDQVLALKWIKQNIEAFGGDPNRITMAGASSGGASIHYHYLSPMSAGLFRNGISMSGTALMPWALTKNSRSKALELGKLVYCEMTYIHEVIKCLRSVPVKSLFEAQANFMAWRGTDFTPFGPVVEKSTKDAFIDRPPIEIIKSGKAQNLTWITGVVSEEGLYPVAEFCTKETVMEELDRNWESIAPKLLQYYHTVPEIERPGIDRKIRNYYLGDQKIDKESLTNMTHLVGDRIFGYGSVMAAKLQAKANDATIYYYYHTYRAARSISEALSGSRENFGVSHGDDTGLIFSVLGDSEKEKEDLIVKEKLIDVWVSLAHHGKPNPELGWKKLSDHSEDFEYLEISGPEQFMMKSNDNLVNNQFWDSINLDENIAWKEPSRNDTNYYKRYTVSYA